MSFRVINYFIEVIQRKLYIEISDIHICFVKIMIFVENAGILLLFVENAGIMRVFQPKYPHLRVNPHLCWYCGKTA